MIEEDRKENQLRLQESFRLLSVYPLPDSEMILWILTEGDRSITTLSLPSEYGWQR
jgi:hypothetical protein